MSWSYLLESDNLTREQLRKFNVNELQGVLKQLNLSSQGKKHELVERLFEFASDLQAPSDVHRETTTSAVKFELNGIPAYAELKSVLDTFGTVIAFLVDPEENVCMVSYRNLDSAQKLHDQGEAKYGFLNATYILESVIEKKAKEMEVLRESLSLATAPMKSFRKTQTEPKIFWMPGNQ